MKELEDLSIRDTKVPPPMLAEILNNCPKITKLDFSFRYEKDWENYRPKNALGDSLSRTLNRIKCLKILTCVDNVIEYRRDPWKPILLLLSLCRDCVDLRIEVVYTGKYEIDELSSNGVRQYFRATVFPRLGWISSLKSLVLIGSVVPAGWMFDYKLDRNLSLTVNNMLTWLFTNERAPRTLQHLWIEGFNFEPPYESIHTNPSLTSHQTRTSQTIGSMDLYPLSNDEIHEEPKPFSRFPKLEFIANMQFSEKCLLPHLPNLKYAHGKLLTGDEQWLDNFVQEHPNLECLAIVPGRDVAYRIRRNHEWNLPKLKVLYCRSLVKDKETFQSLVKGCPNVQILDFYVGNFSNDEEFLTSIKFQHLKSLSLTCFHIRDGYFLPSLAKQCPRLQRLDLMIEDSQIMFYDYLEQAKFASNLASSLPLATHLQDFRLRGLFSEDGSIILLLLKSFLKYAPQLRRLSLIDTLGRYYPRVRSGRYYHPKPLSLKIFSKMPNKIVDFALRMKNLSALCIVLCNFESYPIEEVKQRIEDEVVPSKPSLWFYLDYLEPVSSESDSSVPFCHYQELVAPKASNPLSSPPKIELIP